MRNKLLPRTGEFFWCVVYIRRLSQISVSEQQQTNTWLYWYLIFEEVAFSLETDDVKNCWKNKNKMYKKKIQRQTKRPRMRLKNWKFLYFLCCIISVCVWAENIMQRRRIIFNSKMREEIYIHLFHPLFEILYEYLLEEKIAYN